MAYRRFMDSMDALSTGWSKWIFCFNILQAFLETSKMDVRKASLLRAKNLIPPKDGTYDERVTYAEYEMARLFSLLMSLSLRSLQDVDDDDDENEDDARSSCSLCTMKDVAEQDRLIEANVCNHESNVHQLIRDRTTTPTLGKGTNPSQGLRVLFLPLIKYCNLSICVLDFLRKIH